MSNREDYPPMVSGDDYLEMIFDSGYSHSVAQMSLIFDLIKERFPNPQDQVNQMTGLFATAIVKMEGGDLQAQKDVADLYGASLLSNVIAEEINGS